MDTIADFLTQLQNSQAVRKARISIGFSRIREAIAKILREAGFIEDFDVDSKNDKKKILNIILKYDHGDLIFNKIVRISKPSKRVYCSYRDIYKIHQEARLIILSTPLGVLSAREALRKKIGGEIICKVY